jgi:hypothetical protein
MHLLEKQTGGPHKPAALFKHGAPSTEVESARTQAQTILGKLGKHPLTGNPLFQEYLESLCGGGPAAEKLMKELTERAHQETGRYEHCIGALSDALRPFQTMQARTRFRHEVVRPAQTRQLSSQGVWDAVDTFYADMNGPAFRLLRWAESKFGPLTVCLGLGVEGGAGGGVQGGAGIAGLRYHCVAVTHSGTIAVGAYEDLDISFQIGISPGKPATGPGISVDIAGSAAGGLSAEITVSLVPSFHKPSLAEPFLVDYSFGGLSLSLGLGVPGGGASAGITGSEWKVLPGIAS